MHTSELAKDNHFWIGNFTKSISIYPDELRYYSIARSIYMGDGITLRGAPTSFQKIAYSFVLVPFFAIKDGLLRIKIMNLVNSILIVSSVIPAWLICNTLNLKRRIKVIISLFVILWPETVVSMSFMAENLYWLLFLTFLSIWIYNERKRTYFKSFVAGIVCYLGYMTKEIFLALFLSYILFEMMWGIYQYWVRRKENGKAGIPRERIVSTLIFVGVFILIHVLLKLTVFRGLGNSYDQMSIAAILSPYNFIYLVYAFFYCIAAILIAVFIIPFAYPLSFFHILPETCRKMLTFIMLFFFTASATIAYTISVREDLGRIAPRVHLRYLAPGFIVILIAFLCAIESIDTPIIETVKRKLIVITFGMTVFACILFKGVGSGTPVDQTSLKWYLITGRLSDLIPFANGDKVPKYIGVIIVNVIIILLILIYLFLQRKHWKASCRLLLTMLFAMCLADDIYGARLLQNMMAADIWDIKEVILINDYFKSLDDDIDVVYFTDADMINQTSKFMDTYMDRSDGFYYVDDIFLEEMIGRECRVEDIILKESIWDSVYPKVSKIDYVIIGNADVSRGITLSHCEKMEEISGKLYSVYKNNDPNTISAEYNGNYCYTGSDMMIFFSGNQYNALDYVTSGISDKEDGYSWTDGDVMHVEIPAAIASGKVDVDINVVGTFNGPKSYSVSGAVGVVVGQLDREGVIHFTAEIQNGNISFDLNCEDAQVVNTVDSSSADKRKVAFQISEIILSPVD